MNEGLAVPVRGVAGWECSGGAERQVGPVRDRESLLGRMPERRWRVLGRGRGLCAIEVNDGGGCRAATMSEVDAAPAAAGAVRAAEYQVQRVSADDGDDVAAG